MSYANNSRLDAHGFAPFGEVDDAGMAVLDRMGSLLGNAYGEVQALCPEVQKANTSAFCIYDATTGARKGVDDARLAQPGAQAFIREGFPLMWERRVRSAAVAAKARAGGTQQKQF